MTKINIVTFLVCIFLAIQCGAGINTVAGWICALIYASLYLHVKGEEND